MNKEIEQILNDLENDINAISIESYTGGYEDRENAIETLNKLKLKLFSIPVVSGTVGLEDAKKVLLRYDQAIKEEIAVKLEWLRDHGTHAKFCDIITDIRENVLDTYR